jgi:hypothetical protein
MAGYCGEPTIPTAELDQLIVAANKVSAPDSRAPTLTILKRKKA